MFTSRRTPYLRQIIYTGGILFITFWIALVSLNSKTAFEKIRERGVLRVATLNSPLTFYYDRDQPRGFDYSLVSDFANYLGVELQIQTASDPKRLFQLLEDRQVDLVSANLSRDASDSKHFSTGPSYRQERYIAVYRERQGFKPPKSIEQAQSLDIEVLVNSGERSVLEPYAARLPELKWREITNANRLDLLTRLQNRESELAFIPRSLWRGYASYHPELNIAFELEEQKPVVWYLRRSNDASLSGVIDIYFSRQQTQALLQELEYQPLPPSNILTYFDTTAFREGIEQRYTALRELFNEAAEQTGYDPLFLAAVAYQESHWRADAVSPTGVRGIMMLTEDAAKDVGVEDRTNARQSIIGGAHYLKRVTQKIPQRIPEPDRTYFALAAYNIGFGHLEDARILTQRAGGDADSWESVAEHLPKLEDPAYFDQTKYGQARGSEAVTYVANIRKYQSILPVEAMLADIRKVEIVAPD